MFTMQDPEEPHFLNSHNEQRNRLAYTWLTKTADVFPLDQSALLWLSPSLDVIERLPVRITAVPATSHRQTSLESSSVCA